MPFQARDGLATVWISYTFPPIDDDSLQSDCVYIEAQDVYEQCITRVKSVGLLLSGLMVWGVLQASSGRVGDCLLVERTR